MEVTRFSKHSWILLFTSITVCLETLMFKAAHTPLAASMIVVCSSILSCALRPGGNSIQCAPHTTGAGGALCKFLSLAKVLLKTTRMSSASVCLLAVIAGATGDGTIGRIDFRRCVQDVGRPSSVMRCISFLLYSSWNSKKVETRAVKHTNYSLSQQ